MRFTGRLKSWNDERGFGFIESLQGGQDLFVHIKSFPSGTGRPVIGMPLSFAVDVGPLGKKRATAVEFVRTSRPTRKSRPASQARGMLPRLLLLPAFLLVYAFVAWRWSVGPWVGPAYLVMSLVTFIAYAIDRSAARQGRWRTPEARLHWLALACGWPGALLAQQWLRHKSSKREFQVVFWATVLINVAGFVALQTPIVRSLLH
ncbi:MAG: cold-shock DNA-binding domain [Rhodoferax sp.]|nr:cold-shock DNA-binding domain [Rhodoferax sp.]